MNPTETTRKGPGAGRWEALVLLVLIGSLLGGCEILALERGLKQVRHGIEEADGLGMQEAALYHLNAARSLLDAAEEQYEEADFPAAEQFLDQSESQLQRARRLHTMSGSALSPRSGSLRGSTPP